MPPRARFAFVLALLFAIPAAAVTVTSTADSGPGTLRQAILDANSGACPVICRIDFAFDQPIMRIELTTELPELTAKLVHIEAAADPLDRRFRVVVDGSRAGAGATGLRVNGTTDMTLTGVSFERFQRGAVFDNTRFVRIIGAGFNDNAADGLVVRDSTLIRIGNTSFLGNGGNGLFAQRVSDLGIDRVSAGVQIVDEQTRNARPNAANGIHLDGVAGGAIGGSFIQNNGGNGILLTGATREIEMEFNEFGNNAFLAIDLGGDGPTPNDPRDADDGPNHLQNTPVIEAALNNRGVLRVRGYLDGVPGAKYRISIWRALPDATGFGEGGAWVPRQRQDAIAADANGRVTFVYDYDDIFLSPHVSAGERVTALATRVFDDRSPVAGETSEFSRSVTVVQDDVTFEVTHTSDSGPGSLRAALEAANAADCARRFVCEIAFRIATPPNEHGVWTIRPQSPLPAIARSGIWLDGATQTEFAGDTNTVGPEIEINGAACAGCNGVEIRTLERDVELPFVRNVVINGFAGHGVFIEGSPAQQRYLTGAGIDGSYIGTDATGLRAVPNGGSGVFGRDAYADVGPIFDNVVDGRPPRRNVIAGNAGDGITTVSTHEFGAGVHAFGNIISADRSSLLPLPNGGNGITSGGRARIEANVIAFSTGAGVLVTEAAQVNGIQGNSIHSNGGLGIDVRSTPETAPPVIESARFENGKTRIRFSLTQPAAPFPVLYLVAFFAASFTDASGNGEGRMILGEKSVDGREAAYELEADQNLAGKFISATVTPFDHFFFSAAATTSEFSRSVQVTADNCNGETATLDAPANATETSGPVTFRWSAVPGAIVYRLWVMKPGGPVQAVYGGATPTATITLAPGTYEWWIETRFACLGTQTEHRTITVR